ncbi:MAG: hypothetical protein QXS85_01560 [Acidilobaceae archaeon]
MGSCLVEAISRCQSPIETRVYETLGLWELDIFESRRLVVFVDAIGQHAEGLRVFKVEPERLSTEDLLELSRSLDPHDVAPSTLAVLALASGTLSGECYIVGIPAESLEPGLGLSERALRGALEALEAIERLLGKHECYIRLDRVCVEREIAKSCGLRSMVV